MKEYFKREIMEQNRHQFIYGYDGNERTEFLRTLEEEYPICVDIKKPMAIYMQDYTLPKIETIDESIDKIRLTQIYEEHFNLSIIKNIIAKIINQSNLNITDDRLEKFLEQLSVVMTDKSSVDSLEVFLSELNESMDFYLTYHKDFLEGKTTLPNVSEVKISFIMPELIVPKIKKMLNNDSYFGIIIDKKDDIQLNTIKAINNYVTSRINSDLSMKIACEPDKWPTYYDINGNRADSIHDYGEVKFDNSSREYIKKLIKERGF